MICPFCGEGEWRDMIEAHVGEDGRTLVYVDIVDPCCELGYEHAREWWEEILEDFDDVRRVVWGDRVDYNLELRPVDWATARAFVEEHHEHNRAPQGWRFGFAVWNGRDLVGVTTAGRPVSRHLQAQGCWEITRVCARRDLGPEFAWNACSMLYGAACREIRRRGGDRVVTYVREDERGVTVRAAGFERVARVKPERRGWRRGRGATAPKCRWERRVGGGA